MKKFDLIMLPIMFLITSLYALSIHKFFNGGDASVFDILMFEICPLAFVFYSTHVITRDNVN